MYWGVAARPDFGNAQVFTEQNKEQGVAVWAQAIANADVWGRSTGTSGNWRAIHGALDGYGRTARQRGLQIKTRSLDLGLRAMGSQGK